MKKESENKNVSENYILDSFALLAWFQDEKGANQVEDLIKGADHGKNNLLICTINLGEIYYITYRERGSVLADHALTIIENLPVKIYSADKNLSLKAAEIKALYPIAYADAFAAALGVLTNGTVVTGDPEFKALKKLIKIDWLDK